MIVAHVTSDGSCVNDSAVQKWRRGPRLAAGGWAAVVEVGSEGWVVRGRWGDATSTRMELRAAIEGLRSLPDDTPVVLHTDSTLVLSVWDGWRQRLLPGPLSPRRDKELWWELALEFARMASAEVDLVRKRDVNPQHRRAHVIAQAEARALARGVGEVPIPDAAPARPREFFLQRDPLQAAVLRERRRARRAAMRHAFPDDGGYPGVR